MDQTAYSSTCLAGQVREATQDIFLADAQDSIVDTIGIGLHEIWCGNRFLQCRLSNLVSVRLINIFGQSRDRSRQSLAQAATVRFKRRLVVSIHSPSESH